MSRRPRRRFDDEFKAEAVRLCQQGDRTIPQVAKDLDLTETALRRWVRRAEAEAASDSPDGLTGREREELVELRARVQRLEMEREILKKAATFFAKESR